ncbi:hypothetical protein [Chitinophaga solisilvae]|uniref:hypothetical protein n=1 Tax=Chitinophaga solisilvae TaxID=1233460 RepID=UPI00136AB88A|nr:hypothetical protein [Chitinophaga solisilvae]
MTIPYYIHEGARLRRILRQKNIIILQYAKQTGLTPPGLYRYFNQPVIKARKLDTLLAAIPLTKNDFYHWDSLENLPLHQGELLLLYFAQQKLSLRGVAASLEITVPELYDWLDTDRFSPEQLTQLYQRLGLPATYFTDPVHAQKGVNWLEAYLDKCMEMQHYIRKIKTLEKRGKA